MTIKVTDVKQGKYLKSEFASTNRERSIYQMKITDVSSTENWKMDKNLR